jgi:glycerol uptake facilitator protein
MFRPLDFPWWKVVPYWIAQYMGAMIAACINLLIYGAQFRHYETVNSIVRGSPESIVTASAFGETFPNPGFASVIADSVVSPVSAMCIEAWGTAVLMFVILALTDPNQKLIRNKEALPIYIGFTVAVLISLYAPLTQAGCMCPASRSSNVTFGFD